MHVTENKSPLKSTNTTQHIITNQIYIKYYLSKNKSALYL